MVILISVLVILAILLSSCQSYIDEEDAGVTDDYYCSLLVWHSWNRQSVDPDAWDIWEIFLPGDIVTPYDIYLDNNTKVLYSYEGLGE